MYLKNGFELVWGVLLKSLDVPKVYTSVLESITYRHFGNFIEKCVRLWAFSVFKRGPKRGVYQRLQRRRFWSFNDDRTPSLSDSEHRSRRGGSGEFRWPNWIKPIFSFQWYFGNKIDCNVFETNFDQDISKILFCRRDWKSPKRDVTYECAITNVDSYKCNMSYWVS